MAFLPECRMIFLLIKYPLFQITFPKLQNFGKILNQKTGLKMRIVKKGSPHFFIVDFGFVLNLKRCPHFLILAKIKTAIT